MQHFIPLHHSLARPMAGFTLLELMVVLAIVALTLVTVPSFARMVQQQRVVTEINSLFTHIYLARSETIKRGVNVVLCRSRDGQRCDSEARWHDGWIVFEDLNDNEVRDASETIIHVQQAFDSRLRLRFGTTTDRPFLRYAPDGSASPNATFTLCDRSRISKPRAIVVHTTGRARVSDRNSEGGALSCAWADIS